MIAAIATTSHDANTSPVFNADTTSEHTGKNFRSVCPQRPICCLAFRSALSCAELSVDALATLLPPQGFAVYLLQSIKLHFRLFVKYFFPPAGDFYFGLSGSAEKAAHTDTLQTDLRNPVHRTFTKQMTGSALPKGADPVFMTSIFRLFGDRDKGLQELLELLCLVGLLNVQGEVLAL